MRSLSFLVTVAVLQVAACSDAIALDEATTRDRIRQIEKLSPLERNRLDRNIEEFTKISRPEQDQYRHLHEQIATDRAQNGPAMQAILNAYDLWLQTLSPLQQDELQRETNVAKKLVLVRRFKEEQERRVRQEQEEQQRQEKEQAKENRPAPPSESAPVNFKAGVTRLIAMDKHDIDQTMKVLVADLPPGKQRPDFDPPRLGQYCNIIESHIESKGSPEQWPDEEMVAKIKKVISPSRKWAIANLPGESERKILVRVLLGGIARQADESWVKPNEDELSKTLESLSSVEQEKVRKMTSGVKRMYLTERYFDRKNDDSLHKAKQIRWKVVELFERLDVPIPPQLEKGLRKGDRK